MSSRANVGIKTVTKQVRIILLLFFCRTCKREACGGNIFASMAVKMVETCVFAAVLAENVVHRATVCKYG